MHTEKREDPLVELGYEIRDLNTKAIRTGAIGFFIFATASAVIGFGVFRWMYPRGFTEETAQKRLLPESPNPLIQSNLTTKTDIMDLRQHETKQLTAPIGWTDDSHTKLHIPIEKAMEIIALRGLPSSQTNVPATSPGQGGTVQPGQLGSGATSTGTVTNPGAQAASGTVTMTVPPVKVMPIKKKPKPMAMSIAPPVGN